MGPDEKIIISVAVVALVAILIFNLKGEEKPTNEIVLSNEDIPTSFLTYNQPYMFSPPVANILPQTASGILGQAFGTHND